MDSVDKSAFYTYVISRNKMARLGKGYSTFFYNFCCFMNVEKRGNFFHIFACDSKTTGSNCNISTDSVAKVRILNLSNLGYPQIRL